MTDLVIREARPEEFPPAIEMGRRFYETTDYTQIAPYCRDSANMIGQLLLQNGILLVAARGDHLVGMVGLVLAPFIFNRAVTTAHEVMWWVDPEERDTGGAGLQLLRAIEPACRARGAKAIQMLHLSTSPKHIGVIYRRLGYTQTESLFTKVL